MHPCSRLLKLLTGLALSCSCALGAALSAQSIRINGELARENRTGDVWLHMFTQDGQYLVYVADRAASNQFELFREPADGSEPSVRLNAPLPPGLDVAGFQIGAGNRVVYAASTTTNNTYQLLSVPADGSSSPVLLASSLTSFVLTFFWLNPAGDFVYFFNSGTLWRIPVDGSAAASAVAACPSLPRQVLFSDDGSVLLFVLRSQDWAEHLYRKAADGSGSLVQLHQTESGYFYESTSYSFEQISIAPDGLHVVFEVVETWHHDCDFDCFDDVISRELLSMPTDGSSAAVQLALVSWSNPFFYSFLFDASSPLNRVVYRDGGIVYSVAHDGTQLATLIPSGWTSSGCLDVRGSDVVFPAFSTSENSIMRAPVDGSQVGAPLFTSSTLGSIQDLMILAAGTVVFRGGNFTAGLYTVPLSGGTPLLLTPTLMANHGVRSFLVHPNELTAAFLCDAATADKDELYRVPTDGSQAPAKLNAPLFQAQGDVGSYSFAPDGLAVAYVADPLINDLDGVFRAPLDGLGPVVQYNEPVPTSVIGGDVLEFQATADGTRVVYRADEDVDERFDLFVAGTTLLVEGTTSVKAAMAGTPMGSGAPGQVIGGPHSANLTALLSSPPSVQPGFVLAPSGDHVLFQVQSQSLFSLHSAATTPGPAPIELDSSASAFLLPLAVSPDGMRAVYRKRDEPASSDIALLSVPLDGSSPPVTLHAPFAAGRRVIDFEIDALSRFVVHLADEELDGVFELFSVPLDGSAPPVRLHTPLPAGRRVSSYKVSPDGRHVVFLADLEVAQRFDLYSVPIDGRSAPRKLDQELPDTRDVHDFAISPDGGAVVYRHNALVQGRSDLFRVPIEGLGDAVVPGAARGSSPPARRVIGELREGTRTRLSRGGTVAQNYRFTADGEFVLFGADAVVSSRFDLFRVPSDGSSVPVQLSGPLVPGGDVTSFALSPDQSRVVYLADAVSDQVVELFSVPLAGGPVVRLDPLPSFADVNSYRIDPGSQRVVYRADRDTDSALELFAVPLDGSAPAVRMNTPLTPFGFVESDYVPLPGWRTLYRTDQRTNDVLELFLSLEQPVLPK